MCFLIKKHLTHKILPILALFLLVLNLFFVSEVHADGGYEVVEFDENIVNTIKSLPEYSQYDYFLCKYFEGDAMQNVDCYFFNNSDVWFCLGDLHGSKILCASEYFDYRHVGFSIQNMNLLGANNYHNNIFTYIKPFSDGKYRVFSNVDIFTDISKNAYFYKTSNTFSYPYILQSVGDIETFLGNGIDIFPGSLSSDSTINFSVQHLVNNSSYENVFSCSLNADSSYYVPMYSLETNDLVGFFYGIFYSDMGNFVVGDTYRFVLTYAKSNGIVGTDIREVVIKGESTDIGKGTDEIKQTLNEGFGELKVEFQQNTDKIIESNNKTQEALKENNETNKNIFQKIGDIFNILNPFSENFFAYKLIELLLNALKSLFIPSDNFFNNWLADLNEYFRQ